MTRQSHVNRRAGPKRDGARVWQGIFTLILAAVPAGWVPVCAADNADVETRIKVAFVYNFVRFVEWPAHTISRPVRIGVLGRGDLDVPLQDVIRGKSVNGRPIEVMHITATTESECCEILLIERSEVKRVKEIAQALAEKPILTVCDASSSLRDGVMIAFQIVDESVRFQINREAAEHAGLKISSQLLKVAISSSGKQQ